MTCIACVVVRREAKRRAASDLACDPLQVVAQLELILALSLANRENAGGKTNVLILGRGGTLTNDVLQLVGTDPTSPCWDVTCTRVCTVPPTPPPPLAPAFPSEPAFPPHLGRRECVFPRDSETPYSSAEITPNSCSSSGFK